MTQKYDRFKDAPWFQQGIKPPVLIGGAGGIGSWLTVLLNRAGFETYVYDHDTLEAINMAGQLFMHKSIGQTKVDALAEVVKELCQDTIIANYEKLDINTMTNNIVFSAFDNMKARKDMFVAWLKVFNNNPEAIFIDGRLTAEQLTIFCIKGNDYNAIEEYSKDHLFDDSEVEDLPCTMKQTSHGAAMIASQMVTSFTNWYAGVLNKDTSRYTPFFWEYMLPIGFMNSREANIAETFTKDVPIITDIITTEEALQKANEMLKHFGPPPIDLLKTGEITEQELRQRYNSGIISEDVTLQNEKGVGEETDLTLDEVVDFFNSINEEEITEEAVDFINTGLISNTPNPDPPLNSSDFEEEANPSDSPQVPPPANPNDLPF